MMKLELRHESPSTNTQKPPILFIHGAFTGAWCWDEYFLPYFAKQGYPAYALSLRGHGKSEGGSETLVMASLADYADDLLWGVDAIGETPILVGHSMGGMVVQKYLQTYSAKAVILMNSVPPTGLASCSMYMAMKEPFLFQQLTLMQTLGTQFVTPQFVKKALFSNNHISESILQKVFETMQWESQRVIIDMMWFDLPRPLQKMPPLLVLGGCQDVFFPPEITSFIAQYYGKTDHHLFPNLAHAMMLDDSWQVVADYMVDWLEKSL